MRQVLKNYDMSASSTTIRYSQRRTQDGKQAISYQIFWKDVVGVALDGTISINIRNEREAIKNYEIITINTAHNTSNCIIRNIKTESFKEIMFYYTKNQISAGKLNISIWDEEI